jgi:glutamate/tyrosine decarboxylase-like PLP-dependent enzyme
MDESSRPADTLGMPPEEMRRLGYRVVDHVVEHFLDRAAGPAIVTGRPDALRAAIGTDLPEEPGDPDSAIATLVGTVLASQQHVDHPRYFARVPGPGSFAGVLGDWLATGFNAIATSWGGGSGPTTVELIVCDWLRRLLDLPEGTEGVMVSGGSLANLTALAAVRAVRGPGVAYLADQTHASLLRDLRTLGFTEDEIRVLETDEAFCMPPARLAEAIRADRAAGRRPLLVAATAGTTNTGSVDPLPALADLCAAEDLWLHVDGAYGAPAYLCEKGRRALEGLPRCDSICLDPHKWLFQPYDCGVLLVRHPGVLERAFSMNPEYLKDTMAGTGEVDMRNRTLELTRRGRAIKLWLAMRIHGVGAMRAAIARAIDTAEFAERCLRERPDLWEVVTPARIGIVCFALKGAPAEEHARRAQALADSGYACLSTTVLRGRTVFRLCIINNLTTEADIRGTLERLARG